MSDNGVLLLFNGNNCQHLGKRKQSITVAKLHIYYYVDTTHTDIYACHVIKIDLFINEIVERARFLHFPFVRKWVIFQLTGLNHYFKTVFGMLFYITSSAKKTYSFLFCFRAT